MWTPDEASKSSTYRELKAVHITVLSLLSDLKNRLVKLYTDNQNVARIINCGSMRRELQDIALNIFDLCIQNSISLEVEWIPRDLNTTADFFSKLFDFNDWSVADIYFNYFNNIWGPFDYDLFADFNNHKLPKFLSAYWTLSPLISNSSSSKNNKTFNDMQWVWNSSSTKMDFFLFLAYFMVKFY